MNVGRQTVRPRDRIRLPGASRRGEDEPRLGARPALLGGTDVLQRERHEPDYLLVVAVVALAAIGILMVYSASAIPAYAQSANTFELVGPQIVWCALGLLAMLLLMRVDYRYLRVVSVPFYLFALLLLVAVLVPGIGTRTNGSARWLQFGPLPSVHPAELAKLAMVVYLSHWLTSRGFAIKQFWKGTFAFIVIAAPAILLVVREPDLGTTTVIALTAFTLFFVAGANFLHLAIATAGGVAAAVGFVLTVGGYPLERIRTLLDPWSDPSNTGYHTILGLQAIGLGGLFGTGLGHDRVSVPNDVNDFIFSVIAQELGLVGGTVVIALFLAFAYAGIRTSLRAPDTFGGLLAAGVTAWISFQALINIGVVLAVVPVTGIPLPFVSAGGSSLVISFAAVGVLLSISRETVERGSWNASADRGRGNGRAHLPGSRRRSIAPRAPGRA